MNPLTAIKKEGWRSQAANAFQISGFLLTLVAAAVLAYSAIIAVSSSEIDIGPVKLGFELKPAWQGKTVVDLPPAGSIEADTHDAPIVTNYTLEEINVSEIDELTDRGSLTWDALNNWREIVRPQVTTLIIRGVIAAVVAGGAAAGLLRRSWQWLLAGSLTGLTVALVVAGMTYATYDTEAFNEPHYTGNLVYASEVLTFSQETLANIDVYEGRVPEIAESLYRTVSQLHQFPAEIPEEETIRVLHVSDLHGSEAGAALIQKVLGLYDVDMVVDTGDLTELGLSFEEDYPLKYLPMQKPYIFVAGNHDTPRVSEVMGGISGVTVLDDEYTTVGGLKIGGFPDISSGSVSPDVAGTGVVAQEAGMIRGSISAAAPKPFLAAVHDPVQAQALAGEVPVVLSGHTHQEEIFVQGGTVFINAGSTGGGGYRAFESDGESPSSLQVLYIQKNPQKLIAVDTVTIYGFSQEFTVKRSVFAYNEGLFAYLDTAAGGQGAASSQYSSLR